MTVTKSHLRKVTLLFSAALFFSGCGKKGPLIYPELLVPAAPAEVAARQFGTAMKISLMLPQKDRAGRPLRDLAGIKIFRRESDGGESCRACTSDYALFRKVYLDLPDQSIQRIDSRIIVLDNDVKVGGDYAYFLVPFNVEGVDGEPASPVFAGMVPPPPQPRLKLAPAATEIVLELASAPPSEGSLLGYNIYRARQGEPIPYTPHNKSFIKATFVDVGLERRVIYTYVARSVLRLPNGAVVESGASNQVDAQLLEE